MSIFTRLRDFCGLNDPADYDFEPATRSIHRTVDEVAAELAARAAEVPLLPETEIPISGISSSSLPFYPEIMNEAAPSSPMGSELAEALDFLNEVEEERNQALHRQQELLQVEETHASIEIILDSMEAQGLTAATLEERRQAALARGQSLRERLRQQRQIQIPMRQEPVRPPIPSYVPEVGKPTWPPSRFSTFNSPVLEEDDDDNVPF